MCEQSLLTGSQEHFPSGRLLLEKLNSLARLNITQGFLLGGQILLSSYTVTGCVESTCNSICFDWSSLRITLEENQT